MFHIIINLDVFYRFWENCPNGIFSYIVNLPKPIDDIIFLESNTPYCSTTSTLCACSSGLIFRNSNKNCSLSNTNDKIFLPQALYSTEGLVR